MATSETSTEGRTFGVVSSPMVSIVVPAFNESIRIGDSIRKVEAFLERVAWSAEVIVVDDGSRDDTADIVARMKLPGLRLIRNETNQGKGYSVKAGVLAATGDYVLFTDADLSAPIEELERLFAAVQSQAADVAIGSRAVDRSLIEKHQSLGREFGGIVFNRIVRLFLGLKLYDTQCGFKLFRREKIRPVFEKMTIN